MPRKQEIQAEEAVVSSPLRRSSRISVVANPPAAAKIPSRRTSQTETEPKIPKARRGSLSQETTQKDEDKTENKPAPRGRRASASKEEPEPKPEPAKPRGRRSSAASEPPPEDEQKKQPVTRRRKSTAEDDKPDTEAKPIRGRRSSAADKPAEEDSVKKPIRGRRSSAKDEEPKEEPAKKTTRGRRSSVDKPEELPETEAKDKKPTRGRRPSTENLDDEPEAKAVKLTPVKSRRRLSVTENAVNLEPIMEASEAKARTSTSPVNMDRAVVNLTPIKVNKQDDVKSSLDLSVINEASFTEEPPANADKPEEKVVTPRKSPRLKDKHVLAAEDAQTVRKSPRLNKETGEDADGNDEDEEVFASENVKSATPSTSKNEEDAEVEAAKSSVDGDKSEALTKESPTKKRLDFDSQQSEESTPAEVNETPDEQKTDTNATEHVQMRHVSSGSDGSFRFHLNRSAASNDSQNVSQTEVENPDPEEVLNTSKGSNSSDKENIEVPPLKDAKVTKGLLEKQVVIGNQIKEIKVQETVVARVSDVFRPRMKENSFLEPMDVDEYPVGVEDKTSVEIDQLEPPAVSTPVGKRSVSEETEKESQKVTENEADVTESDTVDDSFQLQLSCSHVKQSDEETRDKTVETDDSEIISSEALPPDNVKLMEEDSIKAAEELPLELPSKVVEDITEQGTEAFSEAEVKVIEVQEAESDVKGDSEEVAQKDPESDVNDQSPVKIKKLVVEIEDFKLKASPESKSNQNLVTKELEVNLRNIADELKQETKPKSPTPQDTVAVEAKEQLSSDSNAPPEQKVISCPDSNIEKVLPEELKRTPDKNTLGDELKNKRRSRSPQFLVVPREELEGDVKDLSDEGVSSRRSKRDSDESKPEKRRSLRKSTSPNPTDSLALEPKKKTRKSKSPQPDECGDKTTARKLDGPVVVINVQVLEKSPPKPEQSKAVELSPQPPLSDTAAEEKNLNAQPIELDNKLPESPGKAFPEQKGASKTNASDDYDFDLPSDEEEPDSTTTGKVYTEELKHESTDEGQLEEACNAKTTITILSPLKSIEDSESKEIELSTNNSDAEVETSERKEGRGEETLSCESDGANDEDLTATTNVEELNPSATNEMYGDKIEVVEMSTGELEIPAYHDFEADDNTPRETKIEQNKGEVEDEIMGDINIDNYTSPELPDTKDRNEIENDVEESKSKRKKSKKSKKRRETVEDADKSEITQQEENNEISSADNVATVDEKPKKKKQRRSKLQVEEDSDDEANPQKPELAKEESPENELEDADSNESLRKSITDMSLEEFANSKLDEYLLKDPVEINSEDESYESSSAEDTKEASEEENEYVCTMAEEGEEDTPSEGSNDIIDVGESIHSTESEFDSDEEYDEDDSFIDNDEEQKLLSGDEFDLDDENKDSKKEKKSRIIKLDNYEDDVIKIKKKEKPVVTKKKSRIISISDSSDASEDNEQLDEAKRTNETAEEPVPPSRRSSDTSNEVEEGVGVNEEEPTADSASSPSKIELNTSAGESRLGSERRRKSSITIHENISVTDIKDAILSGRISQLVDTFCTTIRAGEISMNLSLEHAVPYSPEGSPAADEANMSFDTAMKKKYGKRRASIDKPSKLENKTFIKDVARKSPKKSEVVDDEGAANESFDKKSKKSKRPSTSTSEELSEKQESDQVFLPEVKKRKRTRKNKRSAHKKSESRSSSGSSKVFEIISETFTKIPAKENIYKRQAESDDSDDSSEEPPLKSGKRLSVTLDNIEDSDASEETPSKKRRISKSLDDLDTYETRRKKNKASLTKKKNAEKATKKSKNLKRSDKIKKRLSSEDELKKRSFNIMNQLITDVKNRPKRNVKPSTSRFDLNNSWITEIADVKPSTTIIMKRDRLEYKASKVHPKDFRHQMLYESGRNKRVDTKTLLKKKGAYF